MNSGDHLKIQPSELKFPLESRKQSSCSLHLTNKMDQYVAFKVKTTNPKKYCVRPNAGVILPGTTCDVTGYNGAALTLDKADSFANYILTGKRREGWPIPRSGTSIGYSSELACPVPSRNGASETITMQAQKEAPYDMQCYDKFLVQSVVVPDGVTTKDLTPNMFNKEEGKVVEEFKLRVVYIPANPPSPVPEEAEEGSPPRTNIQENGHDPSLASALISKLSEEKDSAIQQNQRLRQELDLINKEIGRKQFGGFSLLFVVLAAIMGILIGYLLKRT